MTTRIPVYKKCEICEGTGEIKQPQHFYAESNFSTPYNDVKLCTECKGKGKIKTKMFIEDPYNLFEIEEEV